MPTNHDPPRPKDGESRRDGKPAGRSGRPSGRQRAVDPERLRIVAELMRRMDYVKLQKTLAEQWGVSERTIRTYRAMVLQMLRREASEAYFDPEIERLLCIQQLEDLRHRAMAAKDLRTELHVIRTRALVAGVIVPQSYANVQQNNVIVAGGPAAPAIDDPMDAAKRALAQRLAASLVARAKASASTVIDMPALPAAAAAK